MRKYSFLLLILFVFTGFSGMSQYKYELGIRGGMNVHREYGDFAYGVYGQFPLSEKWILQPEIIYSQVLMGNETTKYTTFPVLVKYRVWKGLNLLAGPQMGFNVDNERRSFLSSGDRKATELVAVAGIGYDFKFPVQINWRVHRGLEDVDLGYISGADKARPSMYTQVSVGIGVFRRK